MTALSPFHPRTAGLNAKQAWSEWATYLSPAGYADMHDIEYTAVREAAAVFDVSPLSKYVVSGPDAVRLVDRVITRDAARLEVGQVAYTPWCDEAGKVLDDGTVARLDETRFRWTAADPQYRWLGMNAAGLEVEIEAVTGEEWGSLRYFRRRSCTIAGAEVDVSRTGYTGDLGYELWIPAAAAVEVWDALFAAGEQHGIRPAGLRALDVVRVEAGLILIEVDYTSAFRATTSDHEYSPFEIGLGRLVNFEKPSFVGRRALLRERSRGGPRRRLVGLELDWIGIEQAFAKHDLPPAVSATVSREPVPVFSRRGQVGRATSTCWSPLLKKMVALASVGPRHSEAGTPLEVEWSVEGERGRVGATVVELPFLDLPRRREIV